MTEPQLENMSLSLRQLKHDIVNDLSVVTMGLRALRGVREDADQFAEVMDLVQRNVESLKEKVTDMVSLSECGLNSLSLDEALGRARVPVLRSNRCD